MRRRPTRAAAAVVACGAGLILLSGPAQAAWLAVVGALVLGVALGSVPERHRLNRAQVELHPPERTRVGEPVPVEVVVRSTGHRLPVHRLELLTGPFADLALLVEPVPRHGAARVVVDLPAQSRGVHVRQPVRLSSGAPFGLLRSSAELEATCRVEVGAALVAVPVALLQAVTGATDAAVERRRGVGDEVHAVREYRSGDAMRDVHWRSTARAGRLVVREYERPVPTRSAVVILGGTAGPAFESLVSAAASIAHGWWRAGEPVDVLRVDDSGTPVVLRGASAHGLLSWSAAVQPGHGDLRTASRELLAEVRPTTVVVAAGPGASGVVDGCADLLHAGCSVTLLALPGFAAELPTGVVHRVLRLDEDLVATLSGDAA